MPSGCRREAGERVGFLHGCACPWPRSRRGLGCSACPLAGPGEKGKGAREKRTGHPFSRSIREMPRGTGPLVCHRSFLLTVKEPTPSGLFIFFFFSSVAIEIAVCVGCGLLSFLWILDQGFRSSIHQLFPRCAAVEFAWLNSVFGRTGLPGIQLVWFLPCCQMHGGK